VSERESSFQRWARLKQTARSSEERTNDLPETGPAVVPDRAEMPFDTTSLPPIESIVAETDVTAFLRSGVPADLTRLALRRAWTSDPAIRDFIGIAENQWDFNNPTGVPGFGALAPLESSVDVLSYIASRGPLSSAPSEGSAVVDPFSESARAQTVSLERNADASSVVGVKETPAGQTSDRAASRPRHGGALPT
jgi:Protein of unknown function (DUF3306)